MTAERLAAAGARPTARIDTDRLLLWTCLAVPATFLAVFFVYPLGTVLVRSLTEPGGSLGLGNYARVLALPSFWRATLHSLVMSAATTAVTLAAALVVAMATQRCRVPGRAALLWIVSLPLLAPSLVQGLGLIFLFGRSGLLSKASGLPIEIYGLPGLLMANMLYALPQAVIIIGTSLRAADARLYEAAEVLGTPPWRQFVDITLPSIRFGLLSAAFVTFTVTITDFGNAATIGGDYGVLATEIYTQVVGQMNLELGAVVGIALLLPTVLSFYLERVASRRHLGSLSEAAVPLRPKWLPSRDVPMTITAWAVAVLPLATVGIVVFGSFVRLWPYRFDLTLRHYAVKVAGGYDPLWTTVGVSLAGGVIGTALLLALAFALRAVPPAMRKSFYFVCLLPASVPGLVLGLSYIFAFNRPELPLYALYGSGALLAICNIAHYWTQGFLTTAAALRQVPASIEESAACLGASLLRLLRDVVGPYMAPTLVEVFFFLFVRGMVTLSAVIFLVTASVSLASVSIMRLDEAGFTSQAAAYATCLMGIIVAALAVMKLALAILRKGAARQRRG